LDLFFIFGSLQSVVCFWYCRSLEDAVEPWVNDELWPALEELFEKRAASEEIKQPQPQSESQLSLNYTQHSNALPILASPSDEEVPKKEQQRHKNHKKNIIPKPFPQVSKLEFLPSYSKDKPFMATIQRARILTSPQVSCENNIDLCLCFYFTTHHYC
jgi:hypothetical protein